MNSSFVVATPWRAPSDNHARSLDSRGLLRRYLLATRRGTPGIRKDVTRLNPVIGLTAYGAARFCPITLAESVRYALSPWFDAWALRHLRAGDHLLTNYGAANRSLAWIGEHGGLRFLDALNSHPEHLWSLISEEHKYWKVNRPPIPRHQYDRAMQSLEHTDYFLCPSNFVMRSYKERGFSQKQLVLIAYPTDLKCFTPKAVRTRSGPLRVINTGLLCLRKGTPYLLEAFRMVAREVKDAELWLTRIIFEDAEDLIQKNTDLNINWAPPLPHRELAERLRAADIYVLPSLEEGMARTSLEALACGLPIVVTPNTGSNDFVQHRRNGSVVPIRDSRAIADEILWWWEKIRSNELEYVYIDRSMLGFQAFDDAFGRVLDQLGFESREI
jgi:glycosyltransferase involved in cell wall biosynthesis